MKISKLFLQIGIVAFCFVVGIFGTPLFRLAYAKAFPEPEFTVGNFSTLQERAGKPVVVFATKTCPFCENARVMLKQQNVPYVEYLIDASQENRALFKQYDGRGVPLLLIGERRIEGYRESTIVDALRHLKS
jgi:mycoredoxin